jgi:Fe-S cluster biosynthesis and repair protein YggX
MALFSNDNFKCARCHRKAAPLGYAPIPTELGQRVGTEICGDCWKEWLNKQQQLINHFGLDVSNPDTHTFLFDQMNIFFFDKGVELTQIDTSKEGSVKW